MHEAEERVFDVAMPQLVEERISQRVEDHSAYVDDAVKDDLVRLKPEADTNSCVAGTDFAPLGAHVCWRGCSGASGACSRP